MGVTTAPRETFRDALSVALTVGAYGVAFGAAGIAAHFSVLQTCLFSLLTFTGASQFAAVGVMAAGGGVASAIATATMLSTRNTLYGLQMAPLVRAKGLKRIAAAQITIDESTAVALAQTPRGTDAMRAGFWITGAGVFLFWNVFTVGGRARRTGSGQSGVVGARRRGTGCVSRAAVAATHHWYLRLVAVVSMGFALLITPWLPAGLPIIASVLVAFVFGWRER